MSGALALAGAALAAVGDVDLAVSLAGHRLHLTRTGTRWSLTATPEETP